MKNTRNQNTQDRKRGKSLRVSGGSSPIIVYDIMVFESGGRMLFESGDTMTYEYTDTNIR